MKNPIKPPFSYGFPIVFLWLLVIFLLEHLGIISRPIYRPGGDLVVVAQVSEDGKVDEPEVNKVNISGLLTLAIGTKTIINGYKLWEKLGVEKTQKHDCQYVSDRFTSTIIINDWSRLLRFFDTWSRLENSYPLVMTNIAMV